MPLKKRRAIIQTGVRKFLCGMCVNGATDKATNSLFSERENSCDAFQEVEREQQMWNMKETTAQILEGALSDTLGETTKEALMFYLQKHYRIPLDQMDCSNMDEIKGALEDLLGDGGASLIIAAIDKQLVKLRQR